MRKFLLCAMMLLVGISAFGKKKPFVVPKAVNTVNVVTLKELNLTRSDYQILKTTTAEAAVIYTENKKGSAYTIKGVDEDFFISYQFDKEGHLESESFNGVIRFGYLYNDYKINEGIISPEEMSRRLAIYRLINMVQLKGADGVIEPVISTSVENTKNKRECIMKTTVRAKLIKLK